MGGEAGDGGVGRDVADDGGSGGDNGPLPYLNAWDYRCSGAYPGAFADVDVGTEGRVGGNVYKVGEFTLVVDGDAGIDVAVFYIRLDYRALHDDRSGTYGCIFRNNSGRMERWWRCRRSSVR